MADYRTKPYELEFLNEEKSLELMLRNAFPNRFKEKCPEDLADLATQFSERCGGLPLALVESWYLAVSCQEYVQIITRGVR